MKYKIKIKLLSDMCPSSGEAYNASVDTEVDYDVYGIPCLSAKRIKGCLRESAELLGQWGMAVPVDEIFGSGGFRKGNLRLGSARCEGYREICTELEQHKDSPLVHQQNVLKYFSYIRTQTAMEDGVAKAGSLRVLRVLKKGLVFEAEAEFDEKYQEAMENICKCTRNMGLNRSRGLGEVQITLEKAGQESDEPVGFEKMKQAISGEKEYRLNYHLHFWEPVILKSPDKGQEKTQDYIEGSKMLGILAGKLGSDAYRAMTAEKSLRCSNLYVTDSTERYLPAAASMRVLKDDKSGKVYDLSAGYQINEQTQGLGNVYVKKAGNELKTLAPATQVRYHHSRPEDKSIGRALGEGKGEFYQISSILEGEKFAGFIQGSGEQIKRLKEVLKQMRFVTIGYGSASEYGKAELFIDGIEEYEEKSMQKASEFLVKLEAPVVLYDKMGMYTQEVEALREEMERKLGTALEVDRERIYLKYTQIGGWQSMWKKPKQTAYALDKGTVLTVRTKDAVEVGLPEASIFIGERTVEGYGEVQLEVLPPKQELQKVSMEETEKPEQQTAKDGFLAELEKEQERKEAKALGREKGQELVQRMGSGCAATVNKLLLALKEENTGENFKMVCDLIKDEEKSKIAEQIEKMSNLPEYQWLTEEEYFSIYMKALLTEAKYQARTGKGAEDK